MKTVQRQNLPLVFALIAALSMMAIIMLLLPFALQVLEQGNQLLLDGLTACENQIKKCYGF